MTMLDTHEKWAMSLGTGLPLVIASWMFAFAGFLPGLLAYIVPVLVTAVYVIQVGCWVQWFRIKGRGKKWKWRQ